MQNDIEKNEFVQALCSTAKSGQIPEEHDFFGMLIGSWDIEWTDNLESKEPRSVKGEWIFSRVLDGTAVQDLFIVPSRAELLKNPQPDAEYGTTVRIYNPKNGTWDIFYGCTGEAFRLTARKEKDEIVLTENTEEKMRYIFSEITGSSFLWRKEMIGSDKSWKTVAKVYARKKA